MTVSQKSILDFGAKALEKSVAQKGFARARFARQDRDAFQVKDGGLNRRKSPLVIRGGIVVIAVRRGPKGPAFQAEMRFIHCHPTPRPCPNPCKDTPYKNRHVRKANL